MKKNLQKQIEKVGKNVVTPSHAYIFIEDESGYAPLFCFTIQNLKKHIRACTLLLKKMKSLKMKKL